MKQEKTFEELKVNQKYEFIWDNENENNSAMYSWVNKSFSNGREIVIVVFKRGGEEKKKKNKKTNKFELITVPVEWFVQVRYYGKIDYLNKSFPSREEAKQFAEETFANWLDTMQTLINFFKVDV